MNDNRKLLYFLWSKRNLATRSIPETMVCRGSQDHQVREPLLGAGNPEEMQLLLERPGKAGKETIH